MNLCIDQGNSGSKIALFDGNKLVETFTLKKIIYRELEDIVNRYQVNACIISSVTGDEKELITAVKNYCEKILILDHKTPIPIQNSYKTPETLGKDRLAAVIGARYLRPDSDILVIDAGTAITFDFINSEGQYLGGNIAPGINIRLRSLHEFTQKLPLVTANADTPLLGNDTHSAITSGVLYGIVFEIDGYINTMKIKYPQLSTFLTGGTSFYFATKLKNPIFAEKNLVLIGLNRILQHNVQK